MATHFSILAWKISWTEDPGGLQSGIGIAKSWTQLSVHVRARAHTHTHISVQSHCDILGIKISTYELLGGTCFSS